MSADDAAFGLDYRFHDECGLFGVWNHAEAANLAYLGLYALQHRGQESAGIAATDGHAFHVERAMGWVLRQHAMTAWQDVQQGQPNPLTGLVAGDEALTAYVDAEILQQLADVSGYVGDAPQRATAFSRRLRQVFGS